MVGETKRTLGVALVIAAALVVSRIVLERLGAPLALTNVLGVVWLYLIVPFVFAANIVTAGAMRPFAALFKSLVIFALLTRLMIWPTYSLAYLLGWGEPRFALTQGGVVGDNVSAFMGLVGIPLRNAAIWTVAATLIGMLLGSAVIAIRAKRVKATA